MANTLINVDLTQVPFKALRTGAAVHFSWVGTEASVDTLVIVADGAANGSVLFLLKAQA